MKRERYFKIDGYLRGFEAPDYLRNEATRRTYLQCQKKIITFHRMFIRNYQNEATKPTTWGNGAYIPFDIVLSYHSMKRTTWNRLFHNEDEYYGFNDVLREEIEGGGYKKLNLFEPNDRIIFKEKVEKLNK